MLQDLRAVNATMEDMGALQPGLPSPVAVPAGWDVIVIDLQDCFFTIKLNSEDCKRFAFSVPAINLRRPYRRYQWKVLPQGMKNSPTLCQRFVDQALVLIREKYPEAYFAHYMDDILIAHQSPSINKEILSYTIEHLTKFGLVIEPDKIQKNRRLNYILKIVKDLLLVCQP